LSYDYEGCVKKLYQYVKKEQTAKEKNLLIFLALHCMMDLIKYRAHPLVRKKHHASNLLLGRKSQKGLLAFCIYYKGGILYEKYI